MHKMIMICIGLCITTQSFAQMDQTWQWSRNCNLIVDGNDGKIEGKPSLPTAELMSSVDGGPWNTVLKDFSDPHPFSPSFASGRVSSSSEISPVKGAIWGCAVGFAAYSLAYYASDPPPGMAAFLISGTLLGALWTGL
ncbi:hypothetical protein KJ682_11545 [bacterium]|nr:hypothetical protein [bacterium]